MSYTCKACGEEFESAACFGDDAQCTRCGAWNSTDWDYMGGPGDEGYGIAVWTTGIVPAPDAQRE